MASLIPFNRRRDLMANGFGDFQNMLDDFFTDNWPVRRNLTADTFKIDVREEEKEYTVEAELPGIQKENIHVSMDKGRLNISVKQEEVKEDENKNYVHRERRLCSMSRSIYLNEADQDSTNVIAKLNDGILTITIPKREKDENIRQIEID